jgi:hypothetical protein
VDKRLLTELCALLAIRIVIATAVQKWRGIFKGLSREGEGGTGDFSETSEASLLINAYKKNLISI